MSSLLQGQPFSKSTTGLEDEINEMCTNNRNALALKGK